MNGTSIAKETTWPEAVPSRDEKHFASVVCGNSHLHWALHGNADAEFQPVLFWRTPLISPEELNGDLSEALSRHLPQFAHDYVFGKGVAPSTQAAVSESQVRKEPNMSVYVVSSNAEQNMLLAKIWSGVPCRQFLMKGSDFFELSASNMGVDRLAALRGAADIHGFPCLVFDGGTAMTYTATDSNGAIIGGGIGPGLYTKFRSMHQHAPVLPLVTPDEVIQRVFSAVKEKKPLPVFAVDTKEAMISSVLAEFANFGRNVIQFWLETVGPAKKQASKEELKLASKAGYKLNPKRTVMVTGGDSEVLEQLFSSDHGGILETSRKKKDSDFSIVHSKQLVHYGISAALSKQFKLISAPAPPPVPADEHEQLVQQRVAKQIGDDISRGTVIAIAKAENATEYCTIQYDEGPKEQVTLDKLAEFIKLYSEVGEKEKPGNKPTGKVSSVKAAEAKKPSSAKKRPAAASPPASNKRTKNDPSSHIGTRVAKLFGKDLYFGTIKSYDDSFWHIEYDDGDEEDYDANDLAKAHKLYAKKEKSDPKKKGKSPSKKKDDMDDDAESPNKSSETPKKDSTASAGSDISKVDDSPSKSNAVPAAQDSSLKEATIDSPTANGDKVSDVPRKSSLSSDQIEDIAKVATAELEGEEDEVKRLLV